MDPLDPRAQSWLSREPTVAEGRGHLDACGALHPTRNWRTINQPYFPEIVVPTIKQARKRAPEASAAGVRARTSTF